MTASPPPPSSSSAIPLVFHGGVVGALAPFALFLTGVGMLALEGAPDERGFWPVLLAALTVGLLLARDRTRYADAMLEGMGQPVVMIMVCAWLFSGVLGTVLSAGGLVNALAGGARALDLSGGGYVVASFGVAMLVSTATGTSFGTILLCGPILYPAGAGAAANPAALMGAILAGATFGDSVSPVSDTTIASSGTQRVDIGGTVRARLVYALPAAVVAVCVSGWLGGRGVAAVASAPASTNWLPLGLLAAPLLTVGMLLRRRHLVESLLVGIATAVGIALLLGVLRPYDLLHVEPGSFGATGVIVDGMQRAVGVSVFTLLLVGLVATLQATQVLDQLVEWAARRAHSARGAEAWIVGIVSAAVLLTTHSVVAILAVGEFARQTGTRFGVDGYRRANLLDLTVCTWPFLLPYFLPTILAAGATRGGGAMPVLTAGTVGVYNTYAWALVVMVGVAVVTGYGASRTPEREPTAVPSL